MIDLLDTSKFGSVEYTPYQVYLKALFEFFRADLEAAGGVPADLYSLDLAEFQSDAVERARRILAKYDGVMVCDAVGTGQDVDRPAIAAGLCLPPPLACPDRLPGGTAPDVGDAAAARPRSRPRSWARSCWDATTSTPNPTASTT